jgi:hypothetical protein
MPERVPGIELEIHADRDGRLVRNGDLERRRRRGDRTRARKRKR